MADFNGRAGCKYEKWDGVIEPHGIGRCNSNRDLLLAICFENYSLVMTNTVFKQKEHHKTTWMHPRSMHCHLLDYVIKRKKDRNDVLDARVIREADCSTTDHHTVRSTVAFSIRKKHNKTRTKPLSRLDISRIKNPLNKQELEKKMDQTLSDWNHQDDSDIEEQWNSLTKIMYDTEKRYAASLNVNIRAGLMKVINMLGSYLQKAIQHNIICYRLH